MRSLIPDGRALEPGTHRLTFDVRAYLQGRGRPEFFPTVEVTFLVGDPSEHYHVPVLLSPFGFTVYRGS